MTTETTETTSFTQSGVAMLRWLREALAADAKPATQFALDVLAAAIAFHEQRTADTITADNPLLWAPEAGTAFEQLVRELQRAKGPAPWTLMVQFGLECLRPTIVAGIRSAARNDSDKKIAAMERWPDRFRWQME